MPSIGASQYALTKPGALGTKFNLRPANALRATSGSSILTVATTAYIGQVFPARGAESMSTLLRITRPALLRDRLTARARREPDRDVSGLERTMNDIGQITLQRVNVNGLAQPRSEGVQSPRRRNARCVEQIIPLAEQAGLPVTRLAMAYAIAHPTADSSRERH